MRLVFIPSEVLRRLFDLCATVVLLSALSSGAGAQTSPPNLPPPPANGTWVLLTDTAADNLQSTTTKRYLYVHQDRWYMSPPTALRWNWAEGQGQELTGNYSYYNGVSAATFTCPGGTEEIPVYGIGCSTGGGYTEKVLPWVAVAPPDAAHAEGDVCQDVPDAFGVGACGRATFYVSEVSSEGAPPPSATPPGSGVWVLLTDTVAANLGPGTTKEYLYRYQDRWYLSPKTTLVWNWTPGEGQQLRGAYTYYNGVSNGVFYCTSNGWVEHPMYGIGCGNDDFGLEKLLPTIVFDVPDAQHGQGDVCQNYPDAFGVGACTRATIYVREADRYTFEGFLHPVDNGIVNTMQPGRVVPIRWRLRDGSGQFVSDVSSFTSLTSAPSSGCTATASDAVEELVAPGSTGLKFDAATGEFQFNWQTTKSWRGCRVVTLTLSNGAKHSALFLFR